jgi:Family of unknown function (DUF5908)
MPVQINEMVIRANIIEPGEQQEAGNTGNTAPQANTDTGSGVNKDELVKECAALVMEILNNKNQR